MVSFDQDLLKGQLKNLNALGRAAFTVSCAERLFPLYKLYAEKVGEGNQDRLRSTLDQLWGLALRGQTGGRLPFLDEYEALIPGEDAEWTALNPLAENAVAALAYACRCQDTGEAENAVWAAVQGYEAMDYIAQNLEGIDYRQPEAEAALLKTEYVQAEIQRQLRDLAELESATADGTAIEKVVQTLQNRAKSEGKTLVRVASTICHAKS